jgi:hypothetical protein
MRKKIDFWGGQDEFTRARREKVLEEVCREIEEFKKTAPKPKDLPMPDIRIERREQE